MPKPTIALLFGGKSAEHEISIISARAVSANINRERYRVEPVYIAHDGSWHGGVTAGKILDLELSELLRSTSLESARAQLRAMVATDGDNAFDFNAFRLETDIAFLVLHGSNGEDGKIQGFLETLAIPYTGCGVTASALAMDKALTKLCVASAGLEVADGIVLFSAEYRLDPGQACRIVTARFSFPLFVKPANLGSSVGITKVRHEDELRGALDTACALDCKVLVETAVIGREIEVAVLGNDDPVASIPGEIVPGSDFYDFEDKYIHSDAKMFIPAEIPDETLKKIQDSAIKAYRAVGCRGMSRIDFFLEKSTGRIILNEINTIPGFTDISMYPRMMAATGIDFPELVEKLLQFALEKPSPCDKL